MNLVYIPILSGRKRRTGLGIRPTRAYSRAVGFAVRREGREAQLR